MKNSTTDKMDTTLENISDKSTLWFPNDSWDKFVCLARMDDTKVNPVLDRDECRKRGLTDEQLASTERDSYRTLVDPLEGRVWCVDKKGADALADAISQIPPDKLLSTPELCRDNVPPASEVVELLRKGAFRIYRGYKEELPKKK
jgi:hypothetical protein